MAQTSDKISFRVSPGLRIVLLALTFILGLVLAGFVVALLTGLSSGRAIAMLRIGAVLQDILMLVLPAIVTAIIVTSRPAALLAIDRAPRLIPSLFAVLAMILATPAMNVIIEWNASLHLPQSMASLEEALRTMEESAGAAVTMMLGAHTAGNLIVSVLIIGVLAGFSEELFFRGSLQRLLVSSHMSAAAAIWVTAVIFSAVHFQFFGFVPRLLLGAYFGYLLLWSRSVWLPMLAHIFNNTLYVVSTYVTGSGDPELGEWSMQWYAVAASVILTGAVLYYLRKNLVAKPEPYIKADC